MSTFPISSTTTRRPTTVAAAAILLGVLSAISVAGGLLGMDDDGTGFLVVALVFATLRAVAALGVWRGWRWSAVLGFIVTMLDTLAAIPFLTGDDSTALVVLAATAIAISIPTLILLILPTSRRAYT